MTERIVVAVERRLTRAVERRVGGGGDRRPGRFEQRLVAALERRVSARAPNRADTRVWLRVGRTLTRWSPGAGQVSVPHKTLRTLVVSILARTIVRTLVRLLRVLSRGLISSPMRRLAGLVARRAMRAGPANQVGIMAFLGAVILFVYRMLIRRLAGMPAIQQTAIRFGARVVRQLLALLLRLVARLASGLGALLRREFRRGA